MNNPDLEGLQLVCTPKPPTSTTLAQTSSQGSLPLTELTRINELDDENITPLLVEVSPNPEDTCTLTCDRMRRHQSTTAFPNADSSRTKCPQTRPATADIHIRSKPTEESGTPPLYEHSARNRECNDKDVPKASRLCLAPEGGNGCAISLRSHSEVNLAETSLISPIIIRTSCINKEISAEIVHPRGSIQKPTQHLVAMMMERGLSSSLGDLSTASYRMALEPTETLSHRPIFAASGENEPHPGEAGRNPSNQPRSTSQTLALCSGLQYDEGGACYRGEAGGRGADRGDGGICRCLGSALMNHANVAANTTANTSITEGRFEKDWDACPFYGICPCCKKYMVSTLHLPRVPKTRKTRGLDEISYDFMRASGAISGFSQLRSVKGIKHEREKQEMFSAISSAINASLDASGAVAALAPSARARFRSGRLKKPSIKMNYSQDDGTANTANSLDSSSRNSVPLAPDGDYIRSSSIRRIDDVSKTARHSRQIYNPTDDGLKSSVSKQTSFDAEVAGEHVNLLASPKTSVDNDNAEDPNETPLVGFSESVGTKRPHYWQKAQNFRTSWRTQSVESPLPIPESVLPQVRSLTMVESVDLSETATKVSESEGAPPMKVYVTRGSRHPIKTILVNHNPVTTASAHMAHLRPRRQKTFSNRNQWRSFQISPEHEVEQHSIQTVNNMTRAVCKSHDDYLDKQSCHKNSCICMVKDAWDRTSLSPLLHTACSIGDVTKIKQTPKSSDTAPTSILKSQASRQTSDLHSSEHDETIFSRRQQRMQALRNLRNDSAFNNVGYRLSKRKRLFHQRSQASDCGLALAILGILLMIVENELTSSHVFGKESVWSILLKSLITCSTAALLGFIVLYHAIVVKILSFDECIEDWRIAWDRSRLAKLMIEIIVCAIHPVPGKFIFHWPTSYYLLGANILSSCAHCANATDTDRSQLIATMATPGRPGSFTTGPHVLYPSSKAVSIDIILSLPMFLRLYLIFRVIFLHSNLFTDTASRSIGAMNKVDFTTQFIFKTFMTISPGTVLVAFILGFWAVLSWMLRACERVHNPVFEDVFNSMWLIAVTFLSIGYGDVVANTYCGRAISIVTGVLGSLCTALVVAVFARRLELSRAEKHVIHFMMESTLTKRMKYYAANVLRETWLIYKYTKLVKKLNASTIQKHQRKFLCAIHGLRQMKLEQRKLQDNVNTLVDLAKTQSVIHDTASKMCIQHTRLQLRLESIEQKLMQFNEHFSTLPVILKQIQMQTLSQSATNQKIDDPLTINGLKKNPDDSSCYRRQHSSTSRVLSQASTATILRRDDSTINIVDHLETTGQFAVSFESTQSQKPVGYSRECLNVASVPRANSEPPTSFLAAVRQG